MTISPKQRQLTALAIATGSAVAAKAHKRIGLPPALATACWFASPPP